MRGRSPSATIDGVRRPLRSKLGHFADALLPWVVGGFLAVVAVGEEPELGAIDIGKELAIALAVVQGAALHWRRGRPVLVAAVVLPAALAFQLLVPEGVIPLAGLFAVGSLGGGARNRRKAIREGARRAVGDEQARIARELHDVIAHSVSVIVVQASAAEDVFDTRPDQARAALRSIEQAGRDALRELRTLLGGGPGESDPTQPQPGLARLDELAEPLRLGGLAGV